VFLDEPTSGLDPLGRLLVRDLIRELKREGTAVFLNSHLLGEVEVTCDRVAFVKAGRTVHEMRLDEAGGGLELELRTGPCDAETLEASRASGPWPGRARASRDARRGREACPAIARWLVGRGVALYEMKASRKSLEAWFLEVMGDDQRPG